MRWLENEPLCSHTTFRIGGPARHYAIPESIEEVNEAIAFAKEKDLPYMTIGKGSNLLFSDAGYDGVIIEIGRGIEAIELLEEGKIHVQAGASLSALANFAAKNNLSGLEFAGGIPGSVGGAVTMNAGAYGGEIKDCIVSARILEKDGQVKEYTNEDLQLGYRASIIQKNQGIVLEAVFELQPGVEGDILAKMRELNQQRREKQPLEYPSAGSTFKRPEGYFAGKLIQDAGLRGYQVGDAQVSEKHCGFVINRGNATAADVLQLIQDVKDKVYEEFQVELEPEVRLIGK